MSREDQSEQNVSRAEGVAALGNPREDVASPLIGDRGRYCSSMHQGLLYTSVQLFPGQLSSYLAGSGPGPEGGQLERL